MLKFVEAEAVKGSLADVAYHMALVRQRVPLKLVAEKCLRKANAMCTRHTV